MFKHEANRAVSIYVLGYIFLIILQIVIVGLGLIDVYNDDHLIRFNSILNLSFYGTIFLLFVVTFIPFWKNAIAQFKQHKKLYIIHIAIGFGVLIVVSMIMNLIYSLLGITDTSANQEQLNQLLEGAFFDKFSLIMFAVFLAPMVEEMIFRMSLFSFLMRYKKIKPWLIILITSFIFGFIHVMGAFDLEQIFYYAGLGAVLGFFYYKSKNIFVPIVIHMLLNAFATFSMFFL